MTSPIIDTRMQSDNKMVLRSVTTSPKTHPFLLHLCFPAWLQKLSWKIAPARQTCRQGVRQSVPPLTPPSLHSPLVRSKHTSIQAELHTDTVALSTARSTEQHWEMHTGKASLVYANSSPSLSLCTLFFSYAPPLFTVPSLPLRTLSLSPLMCQDSLHFWKSSISPFLARMKQMTSAAGSLLQL